MESINCDLAFEQPLEKIVERIRTLREEGETLESLERLQQAKEEWQVRLREVYANLSPWQTVQVARHKDRPRACDYLSLICDDFTELHGDRFFGDDPALLGGLATFHQETVLFLAHQKGRGTQGQRACNFGMPHPEGYRKAFRLLEMAGKFKFPVISLIDTPGAFPGLEDEERGQARTIAANLALMARLPVPIIAVVIGEGGSGGALAIGVADRLLMLEHSVYTVAAPEAAASILWRDSAFASLAAEAMHISARELLSTGIVDQLISEPIGGAHRSPTLAAKSLQTALQEHLQALRQYAVQDLLAMRDQKFRCIGRCTRLEE